MKRYEYLVIVHNIRWGDTMKYFETEKEAKEFIDNYVEDINTYLRLYKNQHYIKNDEEVN